MQWAVGLGAVLAAAMVLALVGLRPVALAFALTGYALGATMVLALLRRGYPHADIGLCNLVTLARMALTAALLAPLVAPAWAWAVLGVALVALGLDALDGWLARRQDRASAFGARFDMEVDAALGLVLAVNAWTDGSAGIAVLLLGVPRYVFIATAWIWPWMAAELPDRFGRKVVCVVQIAALIALQAPVVSGAVATALVGVAAVALLWSFGRDTLWLWRAQA